MHICVYVYICLYACVHACRSVCLCVCARVYAIEIFSTVNQKARKLKYETFSSNIAFALGARSSEIFKRFSLISGKILVKILCKKSNFRKISTFNCKRWCDVKGIYYHNFKLLFKYLSFYYKVPSLLINQRIALTMAMKMRDIDVMQLYFKIREDLISAKLC
jgi:hypothetical protein